MGFGLLRPVTGAAAAGEHVSPDADRGVAGDFRLMGTCSLQARSSADGRAGLWGAPVVATDASESGRRSARSNAGPRAARPFASRRR